MHHATQQLSLLLIRITGTVRNSNKLMLGHMRRPLLRSLAQANRTGEIEEVVQIMQAEAVTLDVEICQVRLRVHKSISFLLSN